VSRHARSELAAEMRRRVARARGPRQRLRAIGTAYIDFALTEPGLFRTAFTSHPATSPVAEQDRADAEPPGGGADPFEILGDVLDQCQAAGLLNPHRRPGAEIAAWSAVHGLANLLLDGPLPRTAAGIEFARRQVMELIERGLLNGGSS
jgi:AcrR family transcriptional regulator